MRHPRDGERRLTKAIVHRGSRGGVDARALRADAHDQRAIALEPDFDSFFGGIEAAVAAGGIAVIAVVVVLAIRRFVSF